MPKFVEAIKHGSWLGHRAGQRLCAFFGLIEQAGVPGWRFNRRERSALVLDMSVRLRQKRLMLIVHVQVQVKPEFVEDFRDATLANARASVQEPGIARFDVVQQVDDPTCFVLVEVYRDAEAPARHKETPHYLTWRDTVAPWMAVPRSSVKYSPVFTADSGW